VSTATPLLKPKSKFGRWLLRRLQTLTVAYFLVVLAVAVFQRRLIYYPTKLTPNVAEQTAVREGFVPWRNKSEQIIGWKLPADRSPTASVLIVHGNAGCALDRDYIARPIHDAASVDVFVLEYPGYGAREGSPDKSSLCAAGEEAFEMLPHNVPIFVVSESIGAGVATYLAKTHPTEIAGLMLFVPFDNLASVAQRKMFFLPAYIFLRDRFNPVECLRDYHGPMKIVIAGADEVIPSQSGLRLFGEYDGPKELQIIPGAHHNEVAEQSPEWWKEVFLFWQKNSPKASDRSP